MKTYILSAIAGGILGILYVVFTMFLGLINYGCSGGGSAWVCAVGHGITYPIQIIYTAIGQNFNIAVGIIIGLFIVLGCVFGLIFDHKIEKGIR